MEYTDLGKRLSAFPTCQTVENRAEAVSLAITLGELLGVGKDSASTETTAYIL
jgi:hypothetical protein